MTDYVKFSVKGRYSVNSDYSDPNPNPDTYDSVISAASTYMHTKVYAGIGAWETLTLADMTYVYGMMIRNHSTSSYAGAYVSYYQRVLTETVVNLVATDANPDTFSKGGVTWLTDGAGAGMWVRTAGFTNAGNNGLFLSQNVTNGIVTLAASHTLTTETHNATMNFLNKNRIYVPAGHTVLITGDILVVNGVLDPAENITYKATTSPAYLEFFIVGA